MKKDWINAYSGAVLGALCASIWSALVLTTIGFLSGPNGQITHDWAVMWDGNPEDSARLSWVFTFPGSLILGALSGHIFLLLKRYRQDAATDLAISGGLLMVIICGWFLYYFWSENLLIIGRVLFFGCTVGSNFLWAILLVLGPTLKRKLTFSSHKTPAP